MIVSKNFFLLLSFVIFLLTKKAYSLDNIMFSGRFVDDFKTILVVKNDKVFIREVDVDKFKYKIPDDDCYNLENNIEVCVENGVVSKISGKHHNVYNDTREYKKFYTDIFFNERKIVCDIMKFDIIYKLFVKNEEIQVFETQLYLKDFFSLLRLIVFKKDNGDLQAFVLSDKNDVGCSMYNEYKLYKQKNKDDKTGKKKKNKKIVAKTEKEFLEIVSTESYKNMLLKNYIYLQPARRNTNINKIVLNVQDNKVKYINAVVLDFEWQTFDGDYFYTKYRKKMQEDNNKPQQNDKNKKKKTKK